MTAPMTPTPTAATNNSTETSSSLVGKCSMLTEGSSTTCPDADADAAVDVKAPTAKRRITFAKDPVSDVFIVNRVDAKYNLELFYQPEDFARWRYERNLEIQQQQQLNGGRRRRFQRDSMDLRKSNLNEAALSQPSSSSSSSRDTSPAPPSRITRPIRSSMDLTCNNLTTAGSVGARSPMRPMRPCSRGSSRGRGGPTTGTSKFSKRPMALAA